MDRSAVLLSLQCIVHVVPSWRKTTVSLELFSLLWRMCFDDTTVALMVKSGTEEPELGAATYKTAPKHRIQSQGVHRKAQGALVLHRYGADWSYCRAMAEGTSPCFCKGHHLQQSHHDQQPTDSTDSASQEQHLSNSQEMKDRYRTTNRNSC